MSPGGAEQPAVFAPTHVVPRGGLPTRTEPEASQPAAAKLDVGTEVKVVERRDDWALIASAGGQTGWVDARRLVDRAAAQAAHGTATLVRPMSGAGIGVPAGLAVSSPGRRFTGYLLEVLLAVVTLGIGWLVWALIVFRNGQTPAKQLLDMRVVYPREQRVASWGRMCVRELVAKPIFVLVATATVVGLIAYFWLLWDKDRQQLWDKAVGTVVVDDPGRVLAPR